MTLLQTVTAAPTRRLIRQDRLSAHLAELHGLRALLEQAAHVVETGWVQHGWFAYLDDHGTQHVTTAYNLHLLRGRTLSGACLVGAVVHAGGGPSTATTQPVQRSLDLTWHTLNESDSTPVRWCPGPAVRAAHTRDLTRWNDAPARRGTDVTQLLRASAAAAGVRANRLRELG